MAEAIPICLTVAGSDSCGGAGIQADLRTFNALGAYGTSVLTASTAQTPGSVLDILPIPVEHIEKQLKAVSTIPLRAVKSGMLYSDDAVRLISAFCKNQNLLWVMDPVLRAGTGKSLSEQLSLDELKQTIKAQVSILTPNIPESEIILGSTIRDEADMLEAAVQLSEDLECAVYLKGGHSRSSTLKAYDVIVFEKQAYSLTAPTLRPLASHGTGCTLAAALAATIAQGHTLPDAALRAKAFVWGSLANSFTTDGFSAMFPAQALELSNIKLCRLK